MNSLSRDHLMQVLDYRPETGEFLWKLSMPPRGRVGQRAGYRMPIGYWSISINGRAYYAHRLAWFYACGEWVEEIDHINGNKTDNRIVNLRPATRCQNGWNGRKHKTNTSGYKGVHLSRGRWHARIRNGVNRLHLGIFDTPEAAHAAYCEAATRLHGEFARTN